MNEEIKLKKKSTKKLVFTAISILVIIFLIYLYETSGFLQASKIDERDLEKWQYEDDKIPSTDEFAIPGNFNTCWLLIHSYTASPAEMRGLAQAINSELGDFVFVIKLSGHGEVPNKLLGKNLSVWYKEAAGRYRTLNNSLCNRVNIVGSSFGGVLALRLAEEQDANNVYILNPFIKQKRKLYKPIPFETRLKLFANLLNYDKKESVGKINEPEGKANHIAYLNMPLAPIRESLQFIEETISNLNKIKEPILIQHSKKDEVSDIESSKIILERASSENKILVLHEESNHVLLMDYDKEAVIHNIILFEKKTRQVSA